MASILRCDHALQITNDICGCEQRLTVHIRQVCITIAIHSISRDRALDLNRAGYVFECGDPVLQQSITVRKFKPLSYRSSGNSDKFTCLAGSASTNTFVRATTEASASGFHDPNDGSSAKIVQC